MKTMAPGGMVRALVALGLVSYHALPALAVEKSTTFNSQLQWVTQLIVKEKTDTSGALKTQSISSDGTAMRADVATVQRWSAAAQLPVTYKRPMSGGAHVVTLPKVMTIEDAQAVAQRMESSGQFEYVSPDRIMRPMALATDPLFNQQWNLLPGTSVAGGANVTTAWNTTMGVSTIGIGIVDTGIRADHANFSGAKFGTGYNFVSSSAMVGSTDPKTGNAITSGFVNNGANDNANNNDPSDPGDWVSSSDATSFPTLCGSQTDSSWHGTFVAGQIAAQINNGIGIAGVAPGARVQMARALGKCGGSTSDIMDAMTWLAGGSVPGITNNPTPVKVINMSLGSHGACSPSEQSAITMARASGVTIVVATGNESGPVDAPANCTGTLAVTAHTFEGDNAWYANVGAQTTISAPGGGTGTVIKGSGNTIVSLSNTGKTSPVASPTGDKYANDMGTSMATPHVAAVAALMLSIQPALTPDNVATILKQSARPFPPGTYCATHAGNCGAGMLDAGSALVQTQGTPTVHASTSASSVSANTAVTLTAVGGAGYGKTAGTPVWTQTGGSSVTLTTSTDANGNSTATFTPTTAGVYTFSVALTNSAGATATDTTSVTATTSAPGTGSNAVTDSNNGGGGHLPLWLAGLLLAAGAFGLQRRKTA
ncbi:MprA protease, GlyGly-CTERM protein-sorting domain-containing form [Ralstonia sp. UBA689]|uniref:MprA protease, GlyGly-CTERM protein-sorting domain-containing form n=1 Tax=Ralstonia sp. UBA689 TaxID=1947373 RepID=UPI0026015A98|nr:MprA protease, GlyGly-CTERM protein-sorting domain-containing form [Ralstonia sp. UBA689]